MYVILALTRTLTVLLSSIVYGLEAPLISVIAVPFGMPTPVTKVPFPAPPVGMLSTSICFSPAAGDPAVVSAVPAGVLSNFWTTVRSSGKFLPKTISPGTIVEKSPAISTSLKVSVVADSAMLAVIVLKFVTDVWPILDSVLILATKGFDSIK